MGNAVEQEGAQINEERIAASCHGLPGLATRSDATKS
jgi:hypothetical protein